MVAAAFGTLLKNSSETKCYLAAFVSLAPSPVAVASSAEWFTPVFCSPQLTSRKGLRLLSRPRLVREKLNDNQLTVRRLQRKVLLVH